MNSQELHMTQTRGCVVVVAQRPCDRQMERQVWSRKDTWLNTAVTKRDDGARGNLRTANMSPALSRMLEYLAFPPLWLFLKPSFVRPAHTETWD